MKFHNIIIQARDYYRTLSQKKEVRTIMSGIPVRRLSQSQKKLISQYFKTNIGITTHDTLWHEMYYSINNDFDVRYIPINKVFQRVISRLNDETTMRAYADKNTYDIRFKEFNQPMTILKNRGGDFYIDNKIVSEKEAIRLFGTLDNVIIKPALETGQGHGVFCFHQKNLIVSPEQYLRSLGDNFIIQERVKQHAEIAKLNPSSLNTFRIVTYRERDNVYILNVTLKIGHKGEVVDNGHAGGYFVGTNEDGTLKKWVYSLNPFSKKEMTESEIKVDGLPVPSFHKLKETVCELSLLLPYHRIVGWDMAIGENGNPLLVELNVNGFGVNIIQIPNGALLGKYTEKILNKVK